MIEKENIMLYVVLIVVGLFILIPVTALFYGSLVEGSPTNPAGLTVKHLIEAYSSPLAIESLKNTLLISTIVTILSTVVGFFLAWIVALTDTPWHSFFGVLFMLPFFVSPLTLAIAWVILAAPNSGLINTFFRSTFGITVPFFNIYSFSGIVWCTFTYFVPYAFILLSASLTSIDPSLEEAARISGSNTFKIIRDITLPVVAPAALSASLLIFVLSTSLFSIPGLLGAPIGIEVLSFMVYEKLRYIPSNYPLAAAVSTLILFITMVGIYFYRRTTKISAKYVTITARGYRPKRTRLGPLKYGTFLFSLFFSTITVFLPYSAIVLGAFLKYLTPNLSLELLTLDNFRSVLGWDMVRTSIINTLILTILVPIICIILGSVLAYTILRTHLRGRSILDYISTLPVSIPGMIFALGLIWAFIRTPLYGTIVLLILACVFRGLPYALRITGYTLLQVDKDLEDGARMCGASLLKTIREITMPLLKPGLLSAYVLIAIMIVKELSGVILLYTPQSILMPIMMWNYMEGGEYGHAAALSLIQVGIILVLVIVAQKVLKVKISQAL